MVNLPQNNKQRVIAELFGICRRRGNLTFNNDEVREVCARVGFRNHFDATKHDNSDSLPQVLRDNDIFVVHLGRGQHRFVSGIANGYHEFEPIPNRLCYEWRYRRSLLNNINTSESNTLAVGYNQRVVHDFLYEDIAAAPKVYGSNRTHIPLRYYVGEDEINVTRVQVEIDFTLEHQGEITVFEAKNGEPADFNVFQLFNPFRYYLRATEGLNIAAIKCCYLLRHGNRLRLYLYEFTDPERPGSVQLQRNAQYTLVER